MSELYERIVAERGSLERLFARIPGFKGYQDKQARRTADRMLRDHLVAQVQDRLDRFVRIEQLLINSGGMSYMSRTRDVKSKLTQYKDKINAASAGYSGMWAQMKIGAEEMEKLYAFDEAQIRYVDRFDAGLDALEQAAGKPDALDQAIVDLDHMVVEALEAFDLRDDVITNFGMDNG